MVSATLSPIEDQNAKLQNLKQDRHARKIKMDKYTNLHRPQNHPPPPPPLPLPR